jgi:hypothetical protein
MRYVEDFGLGSVTLRPRTVCSCRRKSLFINYLNRGDRI